MKLNTLHAFWSSPMAFSWLASLNADEVLDLRDERVFDDIWMQHFSQLSRVSLSDDDVAAISLIREQAFKQTFLITENADLASAVSDDFDLIAKSLLSGRQDQWPIQYLWHCYSTGIFPFKSP